MEQQFALFIPTLNAVSQNWRYNLEAIRTQSKQPARFIVADSASSDDTVSIAKEFDAEILSIERKNFDHGGTRQLLAEQVPAIPFLLYMTQDACPANPQAFEHLLNTMQHENIGAAFGRQLPHDNANALAAHARLYNYPPESRTVSLADKKTLGIRAAYLSDSFAIYRRAALEKVGGFPVPVMFGEDMLVAAKMLKEGYSIRYEATAQVHHSHNYGIREEYNRAQQIKVMHEEQRWLIEEFGKAEGQGKAFILSELTYVLKHKPALLPKALATTAAKVAGYKF